MVLDHMEDMEEGLDNSSKAEVAEDYLEEGAEERNGKGSEYTKDPPDQIAAFRT